jgi:hypothetical protein
LPLAQPKWRLRVAPAAGFREALREAYDGGALLACEVVWDELRASFHDDGGLRDGADSE